jgi:hypothetical protein
VPAGSFDPNAEPVRRTSSSSNFRTTVPSTPTARTSSPIQAFAAEVVMV